MVAGVFEQQCKSKGWSPACVLACVLDGGTDVEQHAVDPDYHYISHCALTGQALHEVCHACIQGTPANCTTHGSRSV